jgi:hypothetical protein
MENEEYNPVEPNYYKFQGEILLNDNFTNELTSYNYVYICPYHINNSGKFPFLRYILNNSIFDKLLSFPELPVYKNFCPEELINYSKMFLYGFLMLNDFEKFNEETNFKGFYEFNNNLYLFIDISKFNFQLNDIYSTNKVWSLLLDEILNHKNMCNLPVDDNVTEFFMNNEPFCFLLDDKGDSYEIPIVGFVRKQEKKLNFTYIFGEPTSDKNSMLGPFYYFTNFYNTFLNESEKENVKCGIVRFALFPGSTKYFENHADDDIDESETKKQRLQDENLNQNIERLTMRISDHDGKWAENGFDSAYLGMVELDDGNLFDKPQVALKEYIQQTPLSYHYIDVKTFNESEECHIF